jgi:YegS/Rv2252/BmrU family lipid kinase
MAGDRHGHGHAGHELGPAGWRPSAIEHRPEFATLIVDPEAGRGRVGRAIPAVEAALGRIGLPHRVEVSRARGDAERLAAEALGRGERFLVSMGGDATANEVVNAMLRDDRPVDPDAVLAVLAANSGSDIVRSFGLPQDPVEAVARFAAGDVYEIDVGKATVTTKEGAARSRYFVNMAQAGLFGVAAAKAARLPRFLGRGRYFLGFWLAMARYRRPRVRLQGDRRELEETLTNVLVANLQFFGDGMLASPRSWPEDGYLEVQVFTGPKSESFTLLPKMFQGEHLPHPNVLELRSKTLRIDADRPLWVEADGLPLGLTPATFEAIPRVLRLKV